MAFVLGSLLVAGRLDLVLYGAAGAMCALYGHALPYAARARVLAWVVAGMLAGTAVALTTAALTGSVAVRVVVAALLAGVHKAACDATRIGPPGNVVLTFIAASAAFAPQRLADVPLHVGVGVVGGVVAWLVGMAPALVRPDGPERVAVARALEAIARLESVRRDERDGGKGDDGKGDDAHRARHAAVAAVNAAWQTLLHAGEGEGRDGLRRLLVRAESVSAQHPAGDTASDGGRVGGGRAGGEGGGGGGWGPGEAGVLLGWARELRAGRPVPVPPARNRRTGAAGLAGVAAEWAGVAGRRAELTGTAVERGDLVGTAAKRGELAGTAAEGDVARSEAGLRAGGLGLRLGRRSGRRSGRQGRGCSGGLPRAVAGGVAGVVVRWWGWCRWGRRSRGGRRWRWGWAARTGRW
ncbi:hypothetical protein [Nonomuraea sp. NPDC050783]|uniref:hypothetical protein n=1 Tax=Nonomuraea sp. NPDC050783 TaxID=3154634 RepID=UPI0034668F57